MNPYENISDPVEMLKVMYREKDQDCLIKNLPNQVSLDDICGSLVAIDAPKLLEFLHYLANEKRTDAAANIATVVKLLTHIDLQPFLEILVEKKYLGHSPFLFHGAMPEIRDKLIERVGLKTDWVLEALAWIGDETVCSYFQKWKASPPDWSNSLFVTADKYSLSAGWELTEDGKRRELCHTECMPIVPTTGSETLSHSFQVFSDAPGVCPLCQRNLAYMFKFKQDPNCVIHPALSRNQKFLVCEACIEVTDVQYTEMNEKGDAILRPSGPPFCPPREHEDPLFPRNAMRLASSPRNPYYAATHPYRSQISQLGGYPSWEQDEEYPQCLGCKSTMIFFGQLAYEEFDLGEGILYAFTCEECKKFLAVRYQCT